MYMYMCMYMYMPPKVVKNISWNREGVRSMLDDDARACMCDSVSCDCVHEWPLDLYCPRRCQTLPPPQTLSEA